MGRAELLEAELRPQHAPDRPFRSGGPLRRPADHGAQRLRLYRPCLLEGLLGHRRARSDAARRPSTISRTRPTPGACICRCTTTCCCSSTAATCSRSRKWPTSATTTSRRPGAHGAHDDAGDAQLVGRHGRLRHLQAGGAAPDRLHAGRRRRPASHLVCRRPLGLRLGDDRGLLRLHPHHHRHAGSDQAGDRRPLLAAGHEPRGRRDRRTGRSSAGATACTTRSSPTTSPIAPGATAAWSSVDVADKAIRS